MNRLIDQKYIFGRDNYSCVYCGHEVDEPYISKISDIDDWNPSNLGTTCTANGCEFSQKLTNSPTDQIKGRLVVITGSMFSEKTTTTKSQINKYKTALGRYIWVKPSRDDRGSGITTHNHEAIEAFVIDWQRPDRNLDQLKDYPIVAFDEVQFYSERILYVVRQLLKSGTLVIVNGLKLDFQRNPFGTTHYFLAEADDILALKAVCNVCGVIDVATRTKKRSNSGPSVETGGSDKYYAVCPNCDREEPGNFKF